jgi:hypothetical protein
MSNILIGYSAIYLGAHLLKMMFRLEWARKIGKKLLRLPKNRECYIAL